MDTVTEDDDEAVVEELSEEDKARVKAEARRQRILDSSNDRMDQVAGTGGKESKKLSKLAAMRRIRFKKKASEESGATKKEEGAEDTKTTDTEVVPQPDSQDTAEEEKPTAKGEEEEVVEEVFTPGAQKTKEEGDEENKTAEDRKKYMGVAKMRRRMLKERQQQKQADSASNSANAMKVKATPRRTLKQITVLMHVLVTLLLFGAGLDVGLHSSDAVTATVHRSLAPREGNFVKIIPEFMRPEWAKQPERKLELDTEFASPNVVYEEEGTDVDEFADKSQKKNVLKGATEEGNIDPIFGVDLDELTKGEGIYKWACRQAVSMHRVNLYLFYYMPVKAFRSAVDLVTSFFSVPPFLALSAIILRQFLGNTVLGAKLPDLPGNEDNSHDLIATATNVVKNFFKGSFPTLVWVYSGWMHLREDMYILICGLLVGIAWVHTMRGEQQLEEGRDEL